MTIAEFPITAKFGHQPLRIWIDHHGVAMVLVGCVTFWALFATALYLAI